MKFEVHWPEPSVLVITPGWIGAVAAGAQADAAAGTSATTTSATITAAIVGAERGIEEECIEEEPDFRKRDIERCNRPAALYRASTEGTPKSPTCIC